MGQFNPFENSGNSGSGDVDTSAYATSLLMDIDLDTYVLSGLLKNENGDTLGTAQEIDLPLESMIVDGTYNDTTKKIILILKNGNTVEFSVADLVDGLQTEITSSNKLNSDLVDDSDPNVNKFVTSLEKEQIAINSRDIAVIKSMLLKTYGFKINKNDINPNTRVEYLYDAVGMTPAYMNYTTGEFNYGSWGDIWFIKKNRPVALKYDGTVDYELNHNDYTKKLDGSASDIMNSNYNGNFMSEIPLVWVKRWEDNDYNYVAFSSMQLDEDYHAYAHMNANGDVNNVFYAPLFKGSVINNKMRSIAGQMPSGNTTVSEEKNYAESCGSGWQMWDRSKHELITDLLTLISKSTNSQEKFGEGSYSTTLPTGGYNSTTEDIQTYSFSPTGQFWGSSDTNKHVKVFHIEDFWGSRYERCLGLNMVNYKYVVKMFPPYSLEPDETYDTIDDITVVRSAGTITNVSTGYYGSLPTEIGAIGSSTGYCDTFSPGNNCISIFGTSMQTGAGSYALFFNYLDYSNEDFGGSACFNNS